MALFFFHIGRRNLTDAQRTYLLGKEYEAQKQSVGAKDGFRGNRYKKLVSDQNERLLKNPTRTAVAEKHGVSLAHIQRGFEFAKGLDRLATVEPDPKSRDAAGQRRGNSKLSFWQF